MTGRHPETWQGHGRRTLSVLDLLRVASQGIRDRKSRAALSAIGIAIGVAAMVAVLGVSASSKSSLLDQLDRLGTNLLTVATGQDFLGDDAPLPATAIPMIERLAGVQQAASVSKTDVSAYRNDLIDPRNTNGIVVLGADLDLPTVTSASLAEGRWLDPAFAGRAAVVLGHAAADRLGVRTPGSQIVVGTQTFTVIGILAPVVLAPELDRSVLVGQQIAKSTLGGDGSPASIYVKADPDRVSEVRALLAPTANPDTPQQVDVSRPSDALEARAAAQGTLTALVLGLGVVALIVGGVGVANVMVIAVIERRAEIGLRRALGATRAHIATQFAAESVLLSLSGGVTGVLLGAAGVFAFATSQSWRAVIPVEAGLAGLLSSVSVGVVAGLYPAVRAARLSPADALRS